MKILMVISNFYPHVGGTEKQSFELSSALASMGHEVEVFTRNTGSLPELEDIGGFKIKRVKTFGPLFLDSLIFLVKVFWRVAFGEPFDVVHAHMVSSFAISVFLAAKIRKVRAVFSVSGGKDLNEFTMSKETLFGKIKLAILRLMPLKILVKNNQTFKWLMESGYSKWKIKNFKNGVDTLKYRIPLIDEKRRAKERIGVFGFNFLFVGRISPEKRIKEFIEIFSDIVCCEERKDFNLIVVGDGPMLDEIRKVVSSLGLENRIFIFGKKYELYDFYFASEVFILPSISEGLSNSMLEAMSCGLAVAGSKVGGTIELIKNGENGCLFEPLNKKEIISCLKAMIHCPDIKELGAKNRKIVTDRYSMQLVTKELISIYGE